MYKTVLARPPDSLAVINWDLVFDFGVSLFFILYYIIFIFGPFLSERGLRGECLSGQVTLPHMDDKTIEKGVEFQTSPSSTQEHCLTYHPTGR